MSNILIIKTAALGDVLRTTSTLPGLRRRDPEARILWLTAPGAADLVRHHPLVAEVALVDVSAPASVSAASEALSAERWDWVLSFDDERELCSLASELATERFSGARLGTDSAPTYTADVAPWFDMGLLSVHGKQEADRLKLANQKTHPAIFAEMLGIEAGKPELPLPEAARAFAAAFRERHGLGQRGRIVGFNTGAGGRWLSKQLSPERSVELARELARRLDGRASFLIFGGPAEAERNAAILSGLAHLPEELHVVDAGTENPLLEFAALVGLCDLLVSSDSLALHLAVARDVAVCAFFAPTSAAEIELYGRGEKLQSTAADYCSYRADADNATITVERLADAAMRCLSAD